MSAFREVRRRDRAVAEDDAREILARADYGALATAGADGWPYAVPVNHVLAGDIVYLHCAQQGHKLDNIAHDERVCYCAVASAEVLPKELAMLYESAIVFGRAAIVTDSVERRRAMELLAARFCGCITPEAEREIAKDGPRTVIVRIRIERITGKARRK